MITFGGQSETMKNYISWAPSSDIRAPFARLSSGELASAARGHVYVDRFKQRRWLSSPSCIWPQSKLVEP